MLSPVVNAKQSAMSDTSMPVWRMYLKFLEAFRQQRNTAICNENCVDHNRHGYECHFQKKSTFPLEETFTLEIYAWHFSCKRFISYNFNWLANVSNCFRKEEGCMLDRIMDEKLMRMLSETSFIYVRNKRKLNTPSHIKSLRIEYERRNYRRFSVGSFVRTEI